MAVPRGARTQDGSNDTVPPYARPRDGKPVVGVAAPRSTAAAPGFVGVATVPGYYGGYFPWGYAGLGYLGGYYGGYYGGGYGGSYYDPYDPGYQSGFSRSDESGGLRLKVKPSDATVYVDGYYVGTVNDFDGVFQKLTIEPGTHHVEVRAPGYETLSFDIQIEPSHTTTYRGELKKIQ